MISGLKRNNSLRMKPGVSRFGHTLRNPNPKWFLWERKIYYNEGGLRGITSNLTPRSISNGESVDTPKSSSQVDAGGGDNSRSTFGATTCLHRPHRHDPSVCTSQNAKHDGWFEPPEAEHLARRNWGPSAVL
jgi:hypothetical protein